MTSFLGESVFWENPYKVHESAFYTYNEAPEAVCFLKIYIFFSSSPMWRPKTHDQVAPSILPLLRAPLAGIWHLRELVKEKGVA